LSAYKICHTRQRPIALKSAGLGVWEDVLQVMSVVGILTNCGIMGYTSQVLKTHLTPVIGLAGMVICLFALEHVILFLKYWLSAAIPRVPVAVQRAQARERRTLGRRKEEKKRRRTQLSYNGGDYFNRDGLELKRCDDDDYGGGRGSTPFVGEGEGTNLTYGYDNNEEGRALLSQDTEEEEATDYGDIARRFMTGERAGEGGILDTRYVIFVFYTLNISMCISFYYMHVYIHMYM
jgi:hypothetical protein